MPIIKELNNIVPNFVPMKLNGKVNSKIVIKDDYIRTDGSCALYLVVNIKGKRKRIPLNMSIDPKKFNKAAQRIKGNGQNSKDCNMLIEKALARVNEIELSYRLGSKVLDVETLQSEYANPTPNYDFLKFFEYELEHQKKFLKQSTYRQQNSTLNKLKEWKDHIAFSSIDEHLLKELQLYCKNVLKNQPPTVGSTLKNFKKYLHIANKKGIATSIDFQDIKVPVTKGKRTYLDKVEINKFYKYWESEFIKDTHKFVLAKFLFSVFTSLRISDIQTITRENIIGEFIAYISKKTGKFNRVKLNNSAKLFISDEGNLFEDDFTPEYINRELKAIATFLGIRKKVTFHVARHTFATQYIINGGNVVNLQRTMDHSSIRETMIYVHIVDQMLNDEVSLLDNILI